MALDRIYPGQGTYLRAERNSSTEAGPDASMTPVVMGDIHARIHEGVFFSANYVETGVANNDTIEILLIVTDGTHMRPTVKAGGDALIEVFEGTTVSNNGTEITAANRNRFSSNVAVSDVFHTPTLIGDGVSLGETLIPGGTAGNAGGGEAQGFEEWIFNTGIYLFRITNIAGTAKPMSVTLDFYEDGEGG